MMRKQCLTYQRVYPRDASVCITDRCALATILVDTLTGTVLSERYEIIEELGRGGMGVVYKANQRGLDRIVAIKMILSDLTEDELGLKRFETEAKACSNSRLK